MSIYEFIQSKDITDLAIFLSLLQSKAIDDYNDGISPMGIFETVKWLESEVKTMDKLKPCPFCGSAAELKISNHIPKGFDYTPRCTETACCGRSTKKYSSKAEAISRWNRRSNNE